MNCTVCGHPDREHTVIHSNREDPKIFRVYRTCRHVRPSGHPFYGMMCLCTKKEERRKRTALNRRLR